MRAPPPPPLPHHRLVLAALLLLALLVRLPGLANRGLQGDEIFTLDLVSQPLGGMLAAIRQDLVHPPVYYLLEAPLVALLGEEPWALRVLSLAASLGLVAVAWAWGRRLAGTGSGLLAATLTAAAIPLVLHSQNARSYSLYALVVTGFALVLVRCCHPDTGARGWGLLSGFGALAVMTHYVAALYLVAGLAAVLLLPARRALAPRYLAAMLLPMAVLAAWIAWLVPAYGATGDLAENLSWMSPPGLYAMLSVFVRAAGPAPVEGGTRLVLVMLALLAATAWVAWRRAGPGWHGAAPTGAALAIAASLALLPPLMLFVVSRPPFGIDTWAARHLLPSVVPVALLVAAAIAMIARAGHRLAWGLVAPFLLFHLAALADRMEAPAWAMTRTVAHLLDRPALRRHAVRTTYVHGIAKPVNHYLRLRAGPRPDTVLAITATAVPDTFLLVLRPRVPEERRVLGALRAAGWRDSTVYDAGGEFGVAMRVLMREQS